MAMGARGRKRYEEGLGASERPMAVSYGLIGSVVVGMVAGYLGDMALATSPWLLITGLVLGLVVGFVNLARLMRPRA